MKERLWWSREPCGPHSRSMRGRPPMSQIDETLPESSGGGDLQSITEESTVGSCCGARTRVDRCGGQDRKMRKAQSRPRDGCMIIADKTRRDGIEDSSDWGGDPVSLSHLDE